MLKHNFYDIFSEFSKFFLIDWIKLRDNQRLKPTLIIVFNLK